MQTSKSHSRTNLRRPLQRMQMTEALSNAADTMMDKLLEGIVQAFWEADAEGKVIADSPTWRAHTGQQPGDMLEYGWAAAIYPEDRAQALQEWKEAVKAGVLLDTQWRLRGPDGDWHWANVRAAPVRDQGGRVRKWTVLCIDLSSRKQMEEALARSNERLCKFVAQTAAGMVETDADGRITFANQKFCDMLGYEAEELLGKHVVDITAPESIAETAAAVQRLMTGGANVVLEKQYRRKDGSLMSAESSVSALHGPQNRFFGIIAVVVDVSGRKSAEESVRHAAMHDALTGLPNRAMLFEYASRQLSHNRRHQRNAALIFLDLDRFKPINDMHGHAAGDAVLCEVATRLLSCLRAEDMVVRLGGDEFVILLQDVDDAMHAAEVARHIIDRINEPYLVEELVLSVSTSIGIAVYPADGENIDMLISHADMAMYQAKHKGRNNYQFFSPDYAAIAHMQTEIELRLKQAVADESFHLYYQPIVDIDSGRIVSVEALLRWKNADIGPDRFVPVAETTGLINPIGRWLLREASRQVHRWQAQGMPPVPISINVSVVEFRDPTFTARLRQVLQEEDLAPTALQLEITETAVMENIDHAAQALSELKELGMKILLDDFGTGYSSLAYLARLPINKIKIDKSFVLPSQADIASRAVTSAMIALGRTLGLDVIAEGVESAEALAFVREQGCQQAQGFYLGRPMSGDVFGEYYLHRTAS